MKHLINILLIVIVVVVYFWSRYTKRSGMDGVISVNQENTIALTNSSVNNFGNGGCGGTGMLIYVFKGQKYYEGFPSSGGNMGKSGTPFIYTLVDQTK